MEPGKPQVADPCRYDKTGIENVPGARRFRFGLEIKIFCIFFFSKCTPASTPDNLKRIAAVMVVEKPSEITRPLISYSQ